MAELARPESSVARFRDGTGAVVGAGFLVGGGLVVTCAHVVAAALGRDEQERPEQMVTLEFPVRGPLGPVECTATVAGWTPTRGDDRGDIAVLRLAGEIPDGVRPAQLSTAPAPAGAEIEALGFPDGLAEQGLWARGRIRKEQATGWLQVDSVPDGPRISPGFSGAPVFSAAAGGVVGMVVAVVRDAEQTTTFLNPSRTLVAEHRELHDAQASPYRGLATFTELDVEYFRGRDEVVAAALDRAAAHPLLVLSGPSGSGKSSLARAGLLPRLRAQGRTVVTVRVVPDEPAAGLLARIEEQLTGAPAGHIGAELPGRDAYAVLVDQFEEADPATARAVAGWLYRLAERAGPRPDGAPRLLVVLTLRGRQLDTVATGETAEAMQAGLVLVTPMTAAQLRAAVTPPGAVFEPGLAERLVADAGAEPGTLPLLEFTLDRLWERRELGVLTHAGYDELGGVSGAMAGYADRAYERDPARARRLLVLLARPDDDGVFRRRPLPVAGLPAGLRPALDRLVASRLVVVGPAPDGQPVAELAHESLIRAWPRLRDWLEQDREFRTWLEDVRRAARDWHKTGREPDSLLRGAALATAVRWAEARGPDLGPDEAGFVRASVAQDRRRARRARTVTAALVVLTLLAGTAALVARQQTGEARDQLRNSASRLLAVDAEAFRRTDPGKSLQLALAAWHARQTPEAYGALFTQYAALQPLDRLFTGLTATPDSPISAVSTSRDGSVAVVVDARGGGRVWRGLATGDPQQVSSAPGPPRYVGGTYRVSPSGRHLAYANGLGGVYVRDLTRPDLPPVDLAPSGPDRVDGPVTVRSMQFAPDDTGLAVLRTDFMGSQPELRVWDLRTHQSVPKLPEPPAGFIPAAVYFGPEAGSIVLSDLYSTVVSYDLAGRRDPRTFREVDDGHPVVAGGGTSVVTCGRSNRAVVRHLGTGRQLRSVPVQSCTGFEADANSEFVTVVGGANNADATNVSLVVIDPSTGDVHQAVIPPVGLSTGFEPVDRLAVYRGADGVPAVLLADGGSLLRLRLGAPVTLRSQTDLGLNLGQETLVTPDGAHRVLLDQSKGRITVVEMQTKRQVAAVTARRQPLSTRFQGVPRAITGDSRHLLTAHHGELTVYALPGLTVEHRRKLPVPPDLGGPPETDGISDDWAGSVVAVGGSEAIVLYAGMLTRWDTVTGAQIGEPVPMREGQDPAKRRRAAHLAFASGARPGHPDQVAVVLPDSTVQLWSLGQRRSVATVQVDTALTVNATLFSADGALLAVKEKNGFTAVWPVNRPGQTPWVVPTGITADPLGFTPGEKSHLIATAAGGETKLEIWNLDTAQRVAVLTAPIGSRPVLRGDELGVFAEGYARRLRLDPALWFQSLCALADRPYTREEILLLRARSAPLSRPCH